MATYLALVVEFLHTKFCTKWEPNWEIYLNFLTIFTTIAARSSPRSPAVAMGYCNMIEEANILCVTQCICTWIYSCSLRLKLQMCHGSNTIALIRVTVMKDFFTFKLHLTKLPTPLPCTFTAETVTNVHACSSVFTHDSMARWHIYKDDINGYFGHHMNFVFVWLCY